MGRHLMVLPAAALVALAACMNDGGLATPGAGGTPADSGAGGTGASATTGGSGGTAATGGASGRSSGTGGASGGSGGAGPSFDQVKAWVDAYKAAHPGNGGKDWDLNAKTPAQLAADPDARQLLSLCGPDQRPVIPLLAWEYGGSDHRWIKPEASPLVICVYTPVKVGTAHWQYDPARDRVTADVYVLFPDQNPCKGQQGADQIAACIGDPTNFEILVDTASLNDGVDVGLALATASTELRLILADGSKVLLVNNI